MVDENNNCPSPGLPMSGSTPTGSGFGGGGTAGSGALYPVSPTSMSSNLPLFIPDPSIKGVAFDQLLQNRGIRFIHKKCTPCPNIETVFDNSHNPNCPLCNDGLLFYAEKEIWGVFYSNSLEKNFEYQGLWEIGSAVVTLPTEYPDGTPAEFNTFDQLVIPDFKVRMWELKEYRPTTNRQQQFRYPIFEAEFVASAVNDQLVVYTRGINFNIVDGNIEWVSGQTPSFNIADNKGDVYVVQYYANPVYNVLQHLRELRITQELNLQGQKVPKRLPQQVLVKRDFLRNKPRTE
jgi:ribosomal protein S27E